MAPWARNSMAVMVDAGYIHGTDGKLQPGAPITRAEFAQVLFNLAGNVVDEGQTLSSDVSGNLIVRGSDVKLKNMQIAGDLILAEGAADVKLDNVSVGGRILVKGGSAGVSMTGTKAAKGVLVSSRGKEALLSAKESQLGTVSIQRDTTLSGDYAGVDVQKKAKV
ncbi:S-layer homology domain-containing protein, partial [Anaerotignum sp.]|uniref:S-layer homology domain-containing protein n=1 Tax=Anaerotignum sp. TaxID=2039241 RepID=UPI003735D74A